MLLGALGVGSVCAALLLFEIEKKCCTLYEGVPRQVPLLPQKRSSPHRLTDVGDIGFGVFS